MRTKSILPLVMFVVAAAGVSLHAAQTAARPNVLFIAVDDLRNDLGALGASHARTPQLDAFAATARVFNHHYVQVPTCGASRCALLRGRYPSEPAHVANTAIARTHGKWGDANLPAWFKRHGYQTLALGKITHHPGGLTGRHWAEGPEELPNAWTRTWNYGHDGRDPKQYPGYAKLIRQAYAAATSYVDAQAGRVHVTCS